MDQLKEHIIRRLREGREALLGIPKDQLDGPAILNWYHGWKSVLVRADTMSGHLLPVNIEHRMSGFWDEADHDVSLILRTRVIELIDQSIQAVDAKQVVKPLLEDLISRVADTKLATLLAEFNTARVSQPNLACGGFRTILPLIIRERAKRVDPSHALATKDDIGFEPDINAAIKHPSLFNAAEKKLISRYVKGGDKDSFDNVVHKPDYLIDKNELEDAVNLLNHLLPTIV